jgi:amino acid transporter
MDVMDVKPRNTLDEIVQYLIPPILVILLTVSVFEIFTDVTNFSLAIDIFDFFVMIIFIIDLVNRWKDNPNLGEFLKHHTLDIIATIPFNLIFYGLDYFVFTRSLKGVRIVTRLAKLAKHARLLRLLRVGLRLPRFLRIRKHIKPTVIRDKQPHEKELKGTLSFKVILLITINSIMGTGIFFLTAAGAKHAGPASLLSWVILSIISIYIAMCFSELSSMFPKAGGVYEFAKQAYGRFWSFILGWGTSIAGSVTISMLLLGAMQYLLPIEYSHFYAPSAIFLVLVFNFIAYRGMQTSTYMLVTFALITIGSVVAILIPGIFNFNIGNYQPFFVFPMANIFLAIFFIAETFFGWESAVFLSAETKNPRKVMPKALIGGTVIIAILSISLASVGMGVIKWDTFAESSAPLRDLGTAYFGQTGTIIFTIWIFVSIIGAVACWIVTAPRLLMSIAEDKLFFVQFAKIHPKYKSPYVSILFQVIVVSILIMVGSGSYEMLLHMLIPIILLLYSAVLLSVVILRFKKPNATRGYRVPFGTIGPILTIGFMIFLLYMFVNETHHVEEILRVSGLLITLGIPAYFFIEIFYDDKYVRMRKDFIAMIAHYFHYLPIPNKIFKKVVSFTGPYNKKITILDYNCGVGGFMRYIMENDEVKFKKAYAVDQSKSEIKVFKENIPDRYKRLIKIDERESWKIPNHLPKVDVFVSFNSLGYIQDIPGFLKHMKMKLNRKGRFCFFIHHNIMNVTPNALIVEDYRKLEKMFKQEKLEVKYHKEKKGIAENIFIYGHKK